MSVCELRHAHIVEYLLEVGADVNRVDARQSTPALEAATRAHIEILQALISAGSRLDI
jgi:ankyrin repeat protein